MRYRKTKFFSGHCTARICELIIAIITVISLPLVYCSKKSCYPTASPPGRYSAIPQNYDNKIVRTILYVQDNICDINSDGLTNCIDYTLMFKLRWDKMYPDDSVLCTIVRNKKGNWHHLFIHINVASLDYDDPYRNVLVEPWTPHISKYLMDDNWPSSKYDPNYNIYRETVKWLREVDKEKASRLP